MMFTQHFRSHHQMFVLLLTVFILLIVFGLDSSEPPQLEQIRSAFNCTLIHQLLFLIVHCKTFKTRLFHPQEDVLSAPHT